MTQFCIEEAVFERLDWTEKLAGRNTGGTDELLADQPADPLAAPALEQARRFARGEL